MWNRHKMHWQNTEQRNNHQFVEKPKDVEQGTDQQYSYVLNKKKLGVAQDVEQPQFVEQPTDVEQAQDVEQR